MKVSEKKVKALKDYFKITEDPEEVFPGESEAEREISWDFQDEIARATGGELRDGTIVLDGYLSDLEIPDRAKPVMEIVAKYKAKLKELQKQK